MRYLVLSVAVLLVAWLALVIADEVLVDPVMHSCGGTESIAPDGSVVCVPPDLHQEPMPPPGRP